MHWEDTFHFFLSECDDWERHTGITVNQLRDAVMATGVMPSKRWYYWCDVISSDDIKSDVIFEATTAWCHVTPEWRWSDAAAYFLESFPQRSGLTRLIVSPMHFCHSHAISMLASLCATIRKVAAVSSRLYFLAKFLVDLKLKQVDLPKWKLQTGITWLLEDTPSKMWNNRRLMQNTLWLWLEFNTSL